VVQALQVKSDKRDKSQAGLFRGNNKLGGYHATTIIRTIVK
jgi:hypothetical protein